MKTEPLVADEQRDDSDKRIGYSPSTLDVLSMSFDIGYEENFTGSGLRILKQMELEDSGGPLVDPEVLNAKYPNLQHSFTEPMNEKQAAYIAERQDTQSKRGSIMARYEGSAVVPFIGSLAGGIIDPVGIGVGILTGVGAAGVAGKLGYTAYKTSKTAMVAEALISTAAQEPLSYMATTGENMPYTMEDTAFNAVTNVVGELGIRKGVPYVYGKAKNYLSNLKGSQLDVVDTAAFNQISADKNISIDVLNKTFVQEGGLSKSGVPNDVYKPTGKNFVATTRSGFDLQKSETYKIHDDYGPGVYVTDNPTIANGHAARNTGDQLGDIVELEIDPNARYVELSEKIDESVRNEIAPIAKNVMSVKSFNEDFPNMTMKEFLDVIDEKINSGAVRDSTLIEVQERVKDAGFDGYKHNSKEFMGTKVEPSEIKILFNSEKIKEKSRAQGNNKLVYAPDKKTMDAEALRVQSMENDMDYDPSHKDFENRFLSTNEEFITSERQKVVQERSEFDSIANEMDQMSKLDPENKELLGISEQIKNSKNSITQIEEVMQLFKSCLTNGGR